MELSSILVGGSPWLDLVNTIYLSNGEKQDVLSEEALSREWLVQSQLVPHAQGIEKDLSFISCLTDLRAIFLNFLETKPTMETGTVAFPVDQLNQIAAALNLKLSIDWDEGKLHEVITGITLQEDVLYKILHSFLDTLKNVTYDRIKQCHHDDCILYFLDLSKGGKRKWCRMETCGNRVKASKFYANKKLT